MLMRSRCRWFSAADGRNCFQMGANQAHRRWRRAQDDSPRDAGEPPLDLPLLVFPTKPAQPGAAARADPLISAPSGSRAEVAGRHRPLSGCGAEACRLFGGRRLSGSRSPWCGYLRRLQQKARSDRLQRAAA